MRALPPEGQKILENKAKMDASRMGGAMASPSETAQKGVPESVKHFVREQILLPRVMWTVCLHHSLCIT